MIQQKMLGSLTTWVTLFTGADIEVDGQVVKRRHCRRSEIPQRREILSAVPVSDEELIH